jgi:hypothetical protein
MVTYVHVKEEDYQKKSGKLLGTIARYVGTRKKNVVITKNSIGSYKSLCIEIDKSSKPITDRQLNDFVYKFFMTAN